MPTYEYACTKCGHEMEAFQTMKDAPLKKCPSCGKPALKRLIGGGAGLIFKGSGFYITDYKKTAAPKTDGAATKTSAPAKKTEAPAPKPAASTSASKPAAKAAK